MYGFLVGFGIMFDKGQKQSSMLSCDSSYFCSSQIRTLVAMATFSFHRLIMGKVKICYFCSLIFREMFIE